jgi:predicted nucleic acid-binding protein
MIFYYLDSSAWVKRYYQESGTTWVQSLFEHNQVLACASLGLVEVMATLARKCKQFLRLSSLDTVERQQSRDPESKVH